MFCVSPNSTPFPICTGVALCVIHSSPEVVGLQDLVIKRNNIKKLMRLNLFFPGGYTLSLPASKPGICPPQRFYFSRGNQCLNRCSDDFSCSGNKKCCGEYSNLFSSTEASQPVATGALILREKSS